MLCSTTAAAPASFGQTSAPQNPPAAASNPPAFEVATIKPIDPKGGGAVGFYSRPGGRIFLGYASAKMILYYAFHIQEYQIAGGPDWIGTDKYNIEAIPPDTASSRTAKQPPIAATPSSEQRLMLQSLLCDRFALKFHRESREGEVYLLTRSSKKLQLDPPQHPDWDARGNIGDDGQGFGQNISLAFLADMLSPYLGMPVLDQTGITGRYDFHLDPVDPENHDYAAAIFDAMHRLGLELKKGKGPVDTLVIDHIERPTEN
jgi:uncharacterized protein (TIGR03435 family)